MAVDPKKRIVLREGAPAYLRADADAINAFLDWVEGEGGGEGESEGGAAVRAEDDPQ